MDRDVEALRRLERRIGHAFADGGLLAEALTHSSWSNEHPAAPNNERLEFIGDAALGFVVAGELFRRFPGWDEGKLTAAKSSLVSKERLAAVAASLDVVSCLRLGTGESRDGGARPASLGVNALEAVIGAVLCDGGIDAARRVVLALLGERLDAIDAAGVPQDPRSRLQLLCQERFGRLPVYRIERETGPDHVKEYVCSAATPDGRTAATGKGASKKEAQRSAAEALIEKIVSGANVTPL